MRAWAAGLCICVLAAPAAGCSHRVLRIFFDGVPEPKSESAADAGAVAATERSPQATPVEHGPYAAKLCDACHDRAAQNGLVAPRDQLCARCHELPSTKRYLHGPLASGACLVCHDPHSSSFRALLVSESDGFCFHCHDREAVARIEGHESVGEQCTACHDAHASDQRFLLK